MPTSCKEFQLLTLLPGPRYLTGLTKLISAQPSILFLCRTLPRTRVTSVLSLVVEQTTALLKDTVKGINPGYNEGPAHLLIASFRQAAK
jgi:hypothetical protein